MQRIFGGWRVTIERVYPGSAELARMYDRAAATWNAGLRRMGHPDGYVDLFRRLIQTDTLDPIGDETRVLDAGIGAAAFSMALMQVVQGKPHLVGVDRSVGMLREARNNLTIAGIDTTLYHQDVQSLSFADHTFDVVISAHLLEHVPDPMVAINELLRVLRPGGEIVLVVTRPGVINSLLQLRWRYHTVESAQLVDRLRTAGCTDITQTAAHWLGVAIIARKPGAY
ncbi:MAG: class I SAM-dependent methyltransferase [Blastochloris sp.]|nr:class I SAM-dependent methyltransferase [Blastochloris sp.]